ncbi:hypothetical protein GF386_04100 [Candidatus Pacearchaeota archaeon]|nr:hypothetical protein [Candidatus Pacearchaeota archaeon]
MNKIISIGMLLVLTMLALSPVMAYDESTPYTVTLKWIVPADTTFTVTLCGAESSIDFDDNINSNTETAVQPDCQDNSTSTPILNITNAGNVDLNFTCNLTASKPAWATLYVNNVTDFSGASTFDTTAVVFADEIKSGNSTEVYLWTDISSAAEGTTTRTYQINSLQEPE